MPSKSTSTETDRRRQRLRFDLTLLFGVLVAVGVSRAMAQNSGTAPNATAEAPRALGYNLDYPGDWTEMPPFIDQMKNARAPRGSCSAADAACDGAAHLDLDAAGWVRSLRYRDDPALSYSGVVIYINTSKSRFDIGRRFAVTWDGIGAISVENGGDVVTNAAARRITFTLRPGNTSLHLTQIDPAAHLRNIRVFRADQEALLTAGEVFSPEMLSWLAPFRSLRFMDWMQSNSWGQCSGGSRHGQDCYAVAYSDCGVGTCLMPGRWSERPTADQMSYISWGQFLDNASPGRGTKVGGYPVEVMVALANRSRKNPHFNMPAAYDAEYVQRFAEYVRDHLAAGLVASVEYSNEAWNWGFPQSEYVNALGRAAWPNEGSAWVQYAAGRTHDLCKIWKTVFAAQPGRVQCLISPQTGWPDLAETVLDCPAWAASHPGQENCTQYVDAINITGYFAGCLWSAGPEGPGGEQAIVSWLAEGQAVALERGFQQLNHGGLLPDCDDNLDRTIESYGFFAQLARSRGLGLVVYEGGTHFSYAGADARVAQFLVDMSRDPRMYAAYLRNLDGFWRAGGSTFNAWGWIAPDDAWANADSLLDFNHPKYRALVAAGAVATPVPWRPKVFGCTLTPP